MKQNLRNVALAAVCMSSAGVMWGQAVNAGDIRGTVTDSTGAVVPGVKVTVKNVNTGVVTELTTNSSGLYDTNSIVIGTYDLRFEKDGFAAFERNGITLQTGFSTVNAKLTVGASTETVQVNTDIPLLQTESGEQSTTFSSKSMDQLPNVAGGGSNTGPSWESFTILLPGSAGTPQQSNSSSNPGQVVSVNGNLPYNNTLADGASSTLSHSQNADVSIFETVSELQVSTSAFSAQYGIGGVIFNQISKSGTNQIHGSLYDYFQTDKTNAYGYSFGVPRANLSISRIRFNDFGGTVGGPVVIPKLFNGRDKLFFFFGYDQIVDHGTGSNSTQTVPTEQVKGGDFTGQPLIYDPFTQTIGHDAAGNPYPIRKTFLSEYGTNAIPQALFDKVSANFQKLYPTPANHLAGGSFVPGQLNNVGLLQNNFYSFQRQSTPVRRYFGRLDYQITSNNRLSMSDTQRDVPVVFPNAVTPCPIGCQSGDVDSNNAQITDVWTISSNTVNEARIGYTYQGNFYADQTLGLGYPGQLGWQFAKADSLPAVNFTGSYPYAWIQPASNAVYKEHVFDPSDVVTMVRGKHILHFGGEFLIYRDDSTAWGNTNAGTLQFTGAYTRGWQLNGSGVAQQIPQTGLDYADFLLGQVQNWYAGVSPEYGARLKSPQVFIQDDYKIRPNLTLNLGLRYQIRKGWSEVHGNEATFDPTVTNPANGQLGAVWYGSTQANGRNSLQAPEYKTFLPRVGFSWLPNPRMTVRGGFGIYAYNLSLDTYGSGMGGSFSSTGGYGDQTNGITAVTTFAGNGTNLQTGQPLPYTSAGTSPTRFNGNSIGYNQYHTPTPQIYQYNMAVQNEISTNMTFELAYVGSHGLNLYYPTDLNAVPLTHLNSGGTAFRPYVANYPGSISGSSNNGISNYNSLQASVRRRLSQGLSLDMNYTWSHFLDSIDSSGWGNRSGNQNFQVPNNPAANYSNSNFDIRNAFKGRIVYLLPFGKGRMFMNKSYFLDEIFGGWQASSTIQLQSGNPFTIFGTQQTYTTGSSFPNYSGQNLYAAHKSYMEWFNPAAFTVPADGTFGNVRRNTLYGPGLELVNISAGKNFDITERVKFNFRADASNAFNHVNPSLPGGGNYGLSGGTAVGSTYTYQPGQLQINGTTTGARTMQFSGHVTF